MHYTNQLLLLLLLLQAHTMLYDQPTDMEHSPRNSWTSAPLVKSHLVAAWLSGEDVGLWLADFLRSMSDLWLTCKPPCG